MSTCHAEYDVPHTKVPSLTIHGSTLSNATTSFGDLHSSVRANLENVRETRAEAASVRWRSATHKSARPLHEFSHLLFVRRCENTSATISSQSIARFAASVIYGSG